MWGFKRAGALAAAGLALGVAHAHAAEQTIGSDLAAPATEARSDPNDVVWWAGESAAGAVDVPVKGQAIIMRLKGGTLQPNGPSSNPDYDQIRFVVLRPQGDGTWRTTATSVPHRAPVIGKGGADANTISEYTSEWPLCVEPGDRIGLVSVGGFDQRLFPNGLPYQVFAQAAGATLNEFHAGGMIDQGKTVIRAGRVPRTELLLQVVIGTGDSARPTCGGTAPSGSDPGEGPRPDPTPAPAPGTARAFVLKPPHAPWLYDGRKVKLTIRCGAGADCSGAVVLRARGKSIARRGYDLEAGERKPIVLRINKAGKRMAKPGRRLRARALIDASGATMARPLTIRVPRGG
jgi:hypothetical protein